MYINNKTELLEFIRKQSLKFLKENQAFASLESKLEDVDEGFVQVNEKRFDKLLAEEEKAMSDENYSELQRIKQEKVTVLGKLIASYKKKTELLEQIRTGIKGELDDLGTRGSGVFKDKELKEFKNEHFKKGDSLKIATLSSETKLEKITDNNQYSVISTTIQGIEPGDVLMIPDLAIGHPGKVKVYRKTDGTNFREIGDTTLSTIKAVTKNPS